MPAKLKLLVVDDHPVFRRGLRDIIEEQGGFQVVGEAEDGQTALTMIPGLNPEIILLDIDMPRLNGVDLARRLQRERSPVKLVFLTMYKDEDLFNTAMDLGVKGYVLKENASADVMEALRKVAAGGIFVSPSLKEVKQRRSDRVKELLKSKPQIDDLTAAERRILRLISEDRTSKEIADVLNISVKTVENHRLNICHKLNLHGSHSLLKFAFDNKSNL